MRLQEKKDQRGMGLVVIIGIVAALAIMTVSLVTLTLNVRHNTQQDRVQKTSFNVAEGALDAGMQMLGANWPFTTATQPAFDVSRFRTLFPAAEYPAPDPGRGSFVVVDYYDNLDPVDPAVKYDSNGDRTLWLVAQVSSGPKASRIQSLVQMSYFDMALPRGVALYAGGDLDANGGGNNPKIKVEVPPPTGTTTSVLVGGSINDGTKSVTADGIARFEGSDAGSLDEIFPVSLVESLILLAQQNNRYFLTMAEAGSSPVHETWSPQGGFSGLVVIDTKPGDTIIFSGNTVLNSEDKPGIFVVLGGGTLDWRGTADYYGVIYCEGPMDFSRGTADVHGMIIAAGNEAMNGTPNLLYNDNCIAKLDTRFPSLIRQVPNTWREVAPVF
jgi:hypothetical protein